LPVREALDSALSSQVLFPPHPTLSILDPLVPSTHDVGNGEIPRNNDNKGFSSYARLTVAILGLVSQDRQLGTLHVWVLRHLLALGMFASDRIAVPNAINPVFGPTSDLNVVSSIVHQVQQVIAYLISFISDELSPEWHESITKAITSTSPPPFTIQSAEIVHDLIVECRRTECVNYSRVLRTLLQGLLRSATKTDLDLWLALAKEFYKTGGPT
jgi:hypothetical protein